MKHYLLLIVILLVVSCKSTSNNKEVDSNPVVTSDSIPANTEEVADEKGLKIRFNDFTVVFDSLAVWSEQDLKDVVFEDSAVLDIELGETVDGKILKIEVGEGAKVEIFQQYENSITIQNEGPHCDLVDWKHYYSKWEKLKTTGAKNEFQTIAYLNDEYNNFIPVKMNEVKNKVLDRCGESWYNLVKDSKSVTEYPVSVGMSRIRFKIKLTDSNGINQEKMVVFMIPMGC